jgi:hypothetical protein
MFHDKKNCPDVHFIRTSALVCNYSIRAVFLVDGKIPSARMQILSVGMRLLFVGTRFYFYLFILILTLFFILF